MKRKIKVTFECEVCGRIYVHLKKLLTHYSKFGNKKVFITENNELLKQSSIAKFIPA